MPTLLFACCAAAHQIIDALHTRAPFYRRTDAHPQWFLVPAGKDLFAHLFACCAAAHRIIDALHIRAAYRRTDALTHIPHVDTGQRDASRWGKAVTRHRTP